MKRKKTLIIACVLCVLSLALFGCASAHSDETVKKETQATESQTSSEQIQDTEGLKGAENTEEPENSENTENSRDEQSSETQKPGNSSDTQDGNGAVDPIEQKLASMSLKEKVYQMFVVAPEQLLETQKAVTTAEESTKEALSKYPVGGVIYFPSNLISPVQTKTMISNLQTYSKEVTGLPAFICVDEEGGRVARIANNSAFGVTNVGPMCNIVDETAAYNAGCTIGRYLSELGFNFNFAPDADALTNAENKVINDRSFGADPVRVKNLALQVSNGLHQHGIMSTFKHFPGHGATEGDTHEGYAYTNKTYEELKQSELIPFAAAESGGVDAVMIAHISLPKVIGDNTPCTLSYKVVTEILRNDLGFQGLIVTDAMSMGAIIKNYDSIQATTKAVQAGCDIILMPKDLEGSVNAIIQAVKDGSITEERINASVRRILSTKEAIKR